MNTKYQIITKALDKHTKAPLIIYQELVEPFPIYAVSEQEFNEMTSDVKVKSVIEVQEVSEPDDSKNEPEMIEGVDADFMRFLDADSYHEKIEIFLSMGERLDDRMLNNMAATLDVTLPDDEDAYECILQNLQMRKRFELRR